MKKSLLCTMVLAALCLLLAPQKTQAQYAYGVSDIASSRASRQVYGYSATWLDYYAGYYYDPAVQGELYWQYNNEVPLSQGYTEGYADWIPAEVWTVTSVYQPVTELHGLQQPLRAGLLLLQHPLQLRLRGRLLLRPLRLQLLPPRQRRLWRLRRLRL